LKLISRLTAKKPEMLPKINFEPLLNWSNKRCRNRIFEQDQKIPIRSGLLYLVSQGIVRLTTINNDNLAQLLDQNSNDQELHEPVFLGFIGEGKAFEMVTHSQFQWEAFAHLDKTAVFWLYWHELEHWPHLHQEIAAVFRYQNQQKLIWLSILGQKRTINRLIGFLSLIAQEYGQLTEKGYYLPFPVTHYQIATAIASSRVTITRLMAKLARMGLISLDDDGLIYLSPKILEDGHHY
jgi:CRP-like cAMP-binding protein